MNSVARCLFFRVLVHNSYIIELGQYLQNVEADPLRIIVQSRRDDAEAVWRQDMAIQLVRPVLLMVDTSMSEDAPFESFLEG